METMLMKRFICACALALTTLTPLVTNAGSSAATSPLLPHAEVAAFSNRVQQDLASRGAIVAIVSRVGRDPSDMPSGIEYTHVAFWVYSRITQADGSKGTGYRVYNLYQTAGDLTKGSLVQDMPADFFAGAYSLHAGIVIPDSRLQRKLLEVIGGPAYAQLHNPVYSVLANPTSGQFQNCTEHTLNVLFAAIYDTSDQQQIRANITAYFEPQHAQIGGLNGYLRLQHPKL
jgi:hypothetical protein